MPYRAHSDILDPSTDIGRDGMRGDCPTCSFGATLYDCDYCGDEVGDCCAVEMCPYLFCSNECRKESILA